MKIRYAFVSNSSTSSFLCEVCGHQEAGHDSLGPSDYGFYYCQNEHELCEDCLLNGPAAHVDEPEKEDFETEEEYVKAFDAWDEIYGYHGGDTQPETNCPICQFIEPSQRDGAKYLEKKYSVPRDEVFAVVKAANRRRRKLYDHEYITYVCQKHSVNLADLLPKLKEEFGTYKKFQEYLRSK